MGAAINIGCDVFSIPGLINVDIRPHIKPNVVMNAKKLGFSDCVASEITMGNILEHLPQEDIPVVLGECHRVLEATGVLYITIPLVDVAEQCYKQGHINRKALMGIINGGDGEFNRHLTEFRVGDIERILEANRFHYEPLNLSIFPYMIVSDVKNPRPDPWQYGVKAHKCVVC